MYSSILLFCISQPQPHLNLNLNINLPPFIYSIIQVLMYSIILYFSTSISTSTLTLTSTFLRRSNHNIPELNAPFMVALKVNGTGFAFAAVERTTGNARNFLVANNLFAV